MRVFVTGATGWVGSAVVRELTGAGHQVVGLSRSEEKGRALAAQGAEVLHATLDDLDTLREAARGADAVLHLAFNHDFTRYAEAAVQDRRAIEAIGEELGGTDKVLLVTSGVALLAQGRLATEDDAPPADADLPRRSEVAARELATRGVRAATVRLSPSTHGVGEAHGFVPTLIDLARRTGVSAYVGDGANRWPGVHVDDAARVYRLALESGAGEAAYHAVADEGVAFRDIAGAIGRKLGLPVEPRAPEHFGWLGMFAGADMAASSARTRTVLGWEPRGPGLLADIADAAYYP